MKKYNFYAGPAILAEEVLLKSQEAVTNFENTGLSILEVSHRSKPIVEMMDKAVSLTKELLKLPSQYEVLFMTGGASYQFFMVPMNLLDENQKAGYINTGTWSTKAIKESKNFGNIIELASSEDQNFSYIPKNISIPEDIQYVHLTSNNTIYGTQFSEFPEMKIPMVCDMSSDIFSRNIDAEKYALIYAGAQKNLGPAGTTLVIVNRDFLNKTSRIIPTMLNYQTHIDKKSSFNTPPVYAIYVSMLTLQWIKDNGGIEVIEQRNMEKANLLYNEIDRNPLFYGTANIHDRSLMNVCFSLQNNALEDKFLEISMRADCIGLKGHRSVGGFRASIYNAMKKEGIIQLVEVMQDFERQYG